MVKCLFLILLISEGFIVTLSAKLKVYYVQPTEPHDSASCVNKSSCPTGQQCHTMDYYASNSRTYFSPADNASIVLYFLCGVHTLTRNLFVYNLSTFSMVGTEQAASVVVNMPVRILSYHEESFFTFTNIKKMEIDNLTINVLSIGFKGVNCHLMIRKSNLRGYSGFRTSLVSVLNITHSITSLVNCTLKQNIFVRTTALGVLTLKNCLVERYNHATHSAIQIINSTIVLSGNVQFINNVPVEFAEHSLCGGVLRMSDSNLYIKKAANVSFTSNVASVYGGAVYAEDCRINIFGNLLFINNSAGWEGGAIYMFSSTINLKTNAMVKFLNNSSPHAGAISMIQSQFDVENAHLSFLRNSAKSDGGALQLHSSNLNISNSSFVDFIDNSAGLLGGSALLILARLCVSTNTQVLFANNTAMQGGAAYLYSTVIKITSGSVCIINNTALDVGGGLYTVVQPNAPCFYYPAVGYMRYVNGTIQFEGNLAKNGIGQHIYGSSIHDSRCNYEYNHYNNHPEKPFCHLYHKIFSFHPDPTDNPSVVSSHAVRVCLCDSNGVPKCAQLSKVFVTDIFVYSGETFRLSIAIVGYDFGTTKGTIHSGFVQLNGSLSSQRLLPFQYNQWTDSIQCTNFNYTVFSFSKREVMYLHAHKVSVVYGNITSMGQSIQNWHQNYCIDESLLTTPIFLNITFLPCPPGFHQEDTNGQPSGCICYQVLTDHNFKCLFINKTGYHIWNSSMWVSVTDRVLYYNLHCPLEYCKSGIKVVNLGKEPDAQCAFNHAGTLCGGCQTNYSLAIGSSRCIHCSNNNNITLFLFFAAAGAILVFFILALNLTVTQGLINGLVFYANILWTYKPVWLPHQPNVVVSVIQVFIAWLNLDFGIESCFIRDLNALWKTWLQFLFPLYIWAIAGGIIVVARHSSRITELIGNRAVPLLATLCLLSYMKLLRTVIQALAFAMLKSDPEGYGHAVWYLDGNYSYCKPPHAYLLIAALLALVLLWCPYTLILFSVQWLRRVSHLKCLRWITKFTPFYDACFAPLKDKHQYWFGVLLLVRGVLLLIYSLTFTITPDINLLILIVVLMVLLLYTLILRVYKRKSVKILESLLLGNLIVLSGSTKLVNDRSIILVTSIGLAFVQFCGIVLWSLIKPCVERNRQSYVNLEDTISSDFIHTRVITNS